MISIKNLKSGQRGAGAIADYAEHRHSPERNVGYYQGNSAPSAWHGAGAVELGLTGPVQREDLIAVLEGRLPTGEDLSARGNRAADRRLGVDLTVSCPKSVSLQALAGGDDRILAAHDRAVQAALALIEREVIAARKGRGGTERELTHSMVAATYRHEDARPVDGHVDPQIHTHCIVTNATQRADGAWSAMDLQFGERSVLMHLADAAYKCELARDLQALGYDIRRTDDGFELAHISDAQIAQFSGRRGQIDAALAERGTSREDSSGAQRAAANIATRDAKHQGDRDDQRWQWRQEAREAGVDLPIPQAREHAVADLSTESVRSAVRDLGERETIISRDAIRLQALRAGMGQVDLAAVDQSIHDQAAGLIPVGGDRYTTTSALHREQEILARARAGQGQAKPMMTADQARAYIAAREREQGFAYSDGQRQALELGLTSSDRVVGIIGAAGAGKTTAMSGIVVAARAAGLEVVGIAPSAAASHELRDAGADDTRTLASLLASRQQDGGQPRLYILDEAGMVSARDMDALLQRADAEGARLLLVGDPRQLAAVEAGSPYQQMIESGAIAHADIDEIQRQRDPQLREIAQAFARGEAAEAVALARPYMHQVEVHTERMGRDGQPLPTAPERQQAIAAAVAEDYLSRDKETRDHTLVVSGTNAVRREVNEKIREGLRERGEVACEEVTITALDKADLTRERQTHAESYEPGMVIRLQEGHGRDRHPAEYQVAGVEGDRVQLRGADGTEREWDPARERPAGVYEPRDMSLSVGDRILFTDQQHTDRIRNGEAASIVRVDEGRPVARLESGREIAIDPDRGQTIDHGWARTTYRSQSRTVDHTIIAGEASRVATAELAYVAMSRERDSLGIYTDHPERLAAGWEKWAEREHAITAARATDTPDLEQLQQLRQEAAQELGREGDLARARDPYHQAEIPPPPEQQQERAQEAELER